MPYKNHHAFCALTPRELQVMWLLSQGFPNKQCAERLGCSIRTVEVHRARIFNKLNVRNVLEMVLKLHKLEQL